MGGRVTAYLATTWQLDGRKLQLKKTMDLLIVKLIRIQNENCLMNTDREWAEAVKVFFWQEGGARNCQMVGVILSNHSHELRIHIRTH